jgi:hypothetical protein
MSTLIIDELYENVVFEQPIRIQRSTQIGAIRLWIYKNGTLESGSLRLEVYDGATLLKQVDIPYADINAAVTQPYAHGYIRFDTDPLALNVAETESYHEYTLKFSMPGYDNDTAKYLAVCREWDQRKYQVYDELANDNEEPAGIEIYAFRG